MRLQNRGDVRSGRLQIADLYEHVFGDYKAMFQTLERYRLVTAEDCKRVAKTCFDPRKRTVVTLVPEPKGAQ